MELGCSSGAKKEIRMNSDGICATLGVLDARDLR